MKINRNSSIQQTSQPELQNQSTKPAESLAENGSTAKQSKLTNLEQQRIATEAKSVSNLTTGSLQRTLANSLSARSELINKAATALVPKLPQMMIRSGTDPNQFISAVRDQMKESYAILGSMNDQDIEAIAFLVLMQASKSAQEDLKSIMAQVKSINNSKQHMRELLVAAQRSSRHRKHDDD